MMLKRIAMLGLLGLAALLALVPAALAEGSTADWPALRADTLTEEQANSISYDPPVLGNEAVLRSQITRIEFTGDPNVAGAGAWDVSAAGDDSVLAWVDSGTLTVAGRGGVRAPSDATFLFARYRNAKSIAFNGCFSTADTTGMYGMFAFNGSLEALDLSGFDTSKVTSMRSMFLGCSRMAALDLRGFDTRSVTTMYQMFTGCESLKALDLSAFDTSNVTDMCRMFYECGSLVKLDLSAFDTSNVTDMRRMFYMCKNLASLKLGSFDTSKVTNMREMFYECRKLEALDLSGFHTAQVTDMGCMFFECHSLEALDLSAFDTARVTDMSAMFMDCQALNLLDVSSFDTSNVTDMVSMFENCGSLTALDVNGFDTSNVTDMQHMFMNCEVLTALDVSGFDTSNVKNMNCMFLSCRKLETLDVSGFDTARVTNMTGMFYRCPSLSALDMSSFDTARVENMQGMFCDCAGLRELNLSSFNTENVKDMSIMFNYCTGLERLEVGSFNTARVETMQGMFGNCRSLTALDISGFDMSQVKDVSDMFAGCNALTTLDVSRFDIDDLPAMGLPPFLGKKKVAAPFGYVERDDGTVTLVEYTGRETELNVPVTLDGKVVTAIGNGAFCGNNVFRRNEKLRRIGIPATVTVIEGDPFSGCTALETFSVPEDHSTLAVVDGVLFERDTGRLICYPCRRPGEAYTAPEDTRSIGRGAFRRLTVVASELRRVVLPEGVTDIGPFAFADSAALTSIDLPDTVTSIGRDAFLNTDARLLVGEAAEALREALQSQNLRYTVRPAAPAVGQEVPAGDFTYRVRANGTASIIDYAGNVKALEIPAALDGLAVTRIEAGAFREHSELTKVTLPDTLSEIAVDAFYGCGLTRFDIPDTLTTLDGNPFVNCNSLEKITVSGGHPTLKLVDGVLFSKSGDRLICYPSYRKGKEYTVPRGTEVIGESAFWLESGCALTRIVFPEGVKTLEYQAIRYFYNDERHVFISLPESLTNISGEAIFYYNVTCEVSPDTPAMYAFHNRNCMVRTPKGPVPFYADEEKYTSGPFTYRVLYDGTAEIVNIEANDGPLEIPSELDGRRVSLLGPGSIVYGQLETVRFPDNGLVVCEDAFVVCDLGRVVVPDSVRFAGNPFSGCDRFGEIALSSNHPTLKVADGVLFDRTTDTLLFYSRAPPMAEYTVPAGTRAIGEAAFSFDTEDPGSNVSLKRLVISEGVTDIGRFAIPYDMGIEVVVLPDSAVHIDRDAFYASQATFEVGPDSPALAFCADNGLSFTVRAGDGPEERWQDATVVRCNEWISLRETPSKQADRLAEIPLGARVSVVVSDGEFYKCRYNGMTGYALAEYLALD